MFRWKKTRKSKGEFYQSIRDEMMRLDGEVDDLGCRIYGLAADAVNQAVNLAHDQRLTRQQYIMFALADMMTHVEVGASLARRAFAKVKNGVADAEKMKLISRLFANETAQMVSQGILKIVMGCGACDLDMTNDFMQKIAYTELTASCQNIIHDMDQLADIVFERVS
jgi:alkylation response protein AidB-like acyl-CoA dehydrogenase